MTYQTNFIAKIKFFFSRKPVIIIIGENKELVKNKSLKTLKRFFQLKKDFLIFTADYNNIKSLNFFVQKSKRPIVIFTEMKAIKKEISFFSENLPKKTNLILNIDNHITERIEKIAELRAQKYGFNQKGDLTALKNENSFKINYKGSIVPLWIKTRKKKKIYTILATIAIGLSLGLNLVEISQAFKKNKI